MRTREESGAATSMLTPDSPGEVGRDSSLSSGEERPGNEFAEGQRLRVWRGVALLLLAVGWGLPLLGIFIDRVADQWNAQQVQEFARVIVRHFVRMLSLNDQVPWLPLVVPLTGLVGFLMLVSSYSTFLRLRTYRAWMLAIGMFSTASVVLLGLVVDAQPPGSGLAMLVSAFGIVIGPIAVLGIAVGLLGLMMFIHKK